jgi:hypothetical protein
MLRRWLIRALFILPILLCVVGWVWSGTHFSWTKYSHEGSYVACTASRGVICVKFDGRGTSNGWACGVDSRDAHFWPVDYPDSRSYLGFRFACFDEMARYDYLFAVPFWFLIIVSSAVLFFVWRKTRPKINPKTAFPVEVVTPQ